MARAFCLVALVAGLLAAPGCSCMGGGNTCSSSRRPSFMEFGGCLGGCGSLLQRRRDGSLIPFRSAPGPAAARARGGDGNLSGACL